MYKRQMPTTNKNQKYENQNDPLQDIKLIIKSLWVSG